MLTASREFFFSKNELGARWWWWWWWLPASRSLPTRTRPRPRPRSRTRSRTSLTPQSPTIVGSLGYKGTKIQLYSVPPYVASAVFALACCWASDRLKMRGPFVMFASIVSVIGYAMYRGSTDTHVRYAALFREYSTPSHLLVSRPSLPPH